MKDETQTVVRNVGLLVAQRGAFIFGNFLFAILIPRTMGPGSFGRYTLLYSLLLWFELFSNPGLTQIMGRFVPQFKFQGENGKLLKLFNHLLAMSLVTGTIAAFLYLLSTALWLSDLDLILLVAMAITVVVQASSRPFFTLFLGLNQAARWGMNDTIRRWASLVFLLFGFYLGGLRGACLGLLIAELIVLGVAVAWGRSYLSFSEMGLDMGFLKPYLQFGLIFYVSHLLYAAFQHSGAVLVRFFYRDYIQVSYFGLALSMFLTVTVTISQISLAFAPFMMTLMSKGENDALRQWTEHLLKWLAVAAVLVVFGVLLLGNDLVPLALGATYRPVATNLLPLSLASFFLALGSVANSLTLVYNRPKITLVAAGIRLAAFWGFGFPFVAWWGSFGGCLAVLASSILYAFYFNWRIQKVISYSLRKWIFAIGLGLFFIPLWWLRSSFMVNLVFYGIFVMGYFFFLYFLKIITWEEISALRRVISQKGL